MEVIASDRRHRLRRRQQGHERRRDGRRARRPRAARRADRRRRRQGPGFFAARRAGHALVPRRDADRPRRAAHPRSARRHRHRTARPRDARSRDASRRCNSRKPGDAVLLSPACASLDMFKELRTSRRRVSQRGRRNRRRAGSDAMSWSERFGSKLTGQRSAVANDSAALGGRTSRIGRLSERAEAASGISSAVNGVRPIRSRMLDYDHSLLWVTIALLGLGIVMVYSASIAMPDSPKYAQYRDYHFLVRQLIFGDDGARRRDRRVQDSGVGVGQVRAEALPDCAADAGRRADSARRQGRERRAPLDSARHHEHAAVGNHEARGDDLRGQLHGAQAGVHAQLRPRLPADGGGGRRGRRAAAARTGHGRVHGDRCDRDGRAVPRRRERQAVRRPRADGGRHVHDARVGCRRGVASGSSRTSIRGTTVTRRARRIS